MNSPTDMIKTHFVVLNDEESVKAELYLRLQPVGEPFARVNERHFKRDKSCARLRVGGVYEIEHNDTSYKLAAAKWLHTYRDEEQVCVWEGLQKALDVERERRATEKRETEKTRRLEARLEPLRVTYQGLPAPQRLGFELWVLSVLRRRS